MTFVYSDSTAVVGPLATVREPHSWDLCVSHAGRITAPRGWELVRHAGPLPTHLEFPEDDDLVALADAVREGRDSTSGTTPVAGFSEPTLPPSPQTSAVLAPPPHRSGGMGRRRGHLRVLPDPVD